MSALVGFTEPLQPQDLIGHNGGPVLEDRWYQEEAVDSLFNYFATHGGTGEDGLPIKANPLVCLPTGTGKSVVIARFIQRAMMMHPQTRVFMSTHVKELIAQNAKKMLEIWPLAPLGIYSAGLNKREHSQPITFGGVQSCVGKFPLFGRRDLLVIDEAHLVGNEGRYLDFIEELTNGPKGADPHSGNFNPYLKVIGLSATPYRLGMGCMTNGGIFTDIAYNLCTIDGFTRLIAEGFLCPLIPKRTQTELDVSSVKMSGGDFAAGALEEAVDKADVTYNALCEVVNAGYNRASWLLFASGIKHARHIAEMLNTVFGVPCGLVHSGTKEFPRTDKQNSDDLEAWKRGDLRAIVNMNSLTTGVDHPACDLIAMLRPTMSTGLWVQMLGRGTRPFDWNKLTPAQRSYLKYFAGYVKQNCLVLDFAGNTRRLGPINDPVIPRPKGSGPPGDAPVRICGNCGTYNHASARLCIVCGSEFVFEEKLSSKASDLELLRSNLPQIEWFTVNRVVMVPHESRSTGNKSIKVAYYCGLQTFYEYISVESNINFFRKKSRDWFRQRYHYSTPQYTWAEDVPATNDEVLMLAQELRPPLRIKVWVNKQTPEVQGYEF
ncbi:SSL2 DNA or RNA helicases of superfamily II [uncultured Caudovirales phage]|uniref:SSL2 DNA or RNA helicases of superfamily II n=1 Tax=uncultured Caudovirales phage TaxID=2100421 RepID=A0A6J5LFD0_9CAUD|nr:SSL2 DNA or RNA helicases of superfamily II [uncultured Caudovirales phage]